MNRNYRAGRAKEYAAVTTLERRGWYAQRTAGSHGLFDIAALHPNGGALFVQIKRGRKPSVTQDENLAVFAALKNPHVIRELWWYPKGQSRPIITVL